MRSSNDGVGLASERGSALIEGVVCMAVILAIGLGALWTGNIMLRYYQMEKAVQSAARYATRSESIPGQSSANRRRSATEISTFLANAVKNGKPAISSSDVTIDIQCGTSPSSLSTCTNPESQPPGNFVQVKASLLVASSDPVMAFARSVNGLLGVLHVGAPFPASVTVTNASVAMVE